MTRQKLKELSSETRSFTAYSLDLSPTDLPLLKALQQENIFNNQTAAQNAFKESSVPGLENSRIPE